MRGTKGIAVSQIILLVLGILVLAVVAYLLYSNFVTTGGAISAEQCRAAATRACTACSIANAGSVSNCLASSYLASAMDKQCAFEGKISGASASKDSAGAITVSTTTKINCDQYVGGTAGTGTTTPPATTPPVATPPATTTCSDQQCKDKGGVIVVGGTDAGKCIAAGVFVTC